MKKKLVTKISYALLIVMLALRALPVTPSHAAACTSNGTGGGNWNVGATWSGCTGIGGVPAAIDTITIQNGDTVTINAAATIAGLTVGQGTSGILQFEQANARTLTVNGDVTVAAGGTFISNAAGTVTTHTLSLSGNLTNNGTLDFSTNGDTAAARITFTGATNNTFSGTGATTDIRTITINKGVAATNILEVTTSNFTVRGVTTDVAGYLTLTNGTFKLSGSFAGTNRLFVAAGYTIGATTGFWLNNTTYTVAGQNNDVFLNGMLRVSAGTYNIGTASGDDLRNNTGGQLTIDGGTLNIAGDLAGVSNPPTEALVFDMSSGSLTVGTQGNNSSFRANFDISAAGSSFKMSGGTIFIQQANMGSGLDYTNQAGTVNVTGGTVQFGNASTPAAQTFLVAANSVFPSLVINATNAPTTRLNGAVTVQGNVTINAATTLNANNQNITVSGNWTNNGTFTAGMGAVTFNGSGAQTINGANTWYGLAITGTTPRSVTFQSGVTQTITNSLTFTGTAGNLLTLAPGTPATTWGLNAPATQLVSYVSPSYSNASFGNMVNAANSVNGGNNTNWNFGASPAITSVDNTTFTAGTAGTFTVTATGSPAPTLSVTGALPSGVTFIPGTGVLSGTPAAGTAGTYPLTFTAANGVGTDASQNFTLTVNEAPAITNTNATTFTVGTAGTFTVTATGFPTPTLSVTGALPSGVNFIPGTGVLCGTPAAGTGGTYPLTFTAANGVGKDATQSFTLTINEALAITSANATTFTVGTAGTFTVTATGSPAPTLSVTGALPSGVTFIPGTGVLSGTPTAGTGGTYPLTFTAANGVEADATQNFTFTVNEAPVITSANTTTFTAGTAGTFTVTAAGSPASTLSVTGALPSGVTFIPGTGVLSGIPSAGTEGTYPLTFTASNGVGTDATQSFTLVINPTGGGGGGGIPQPSFSDVPTDYWAWQYIEAIYAVGITSGCNTYPLNYCPTAPVTRAEMAIFLLRGTHGKYYNPPTATGVVFTDVPADYWAADWVEQLALEGITSGCGDGIYCPDAPITRAQMSIFLLRTKYGSDYVPPTATGTLFADVPVDYWAADWVEQLFYEDIARGCGDGNFCPDTDVTRDQMAVFLQRLFDFPLP